MRTSPRGWPRQGSHSLDGIDLLDTELGPPASGDALAVFECAAHAVHDAGDHAILVGRVLRFARREAGAPLVFFKGRYGALSDTRPAEPRQRDRDTVLLCATDLAANAPGPRQSQNLHTNVTHPSTPIGIDARARGPRGRRTGPSGPAWRISMSAPHPMESDRYEGEDNSDGERRGRDGCYVCRAGFGRRLVGEHQHQRAHVLRLHQLDAKSHVYNAGLGRYVTTNSTNNGVSFDIKRFYVGIDHKFNDIFSANVTTDFTYDSSIGRDRRSTSRRPICRPTCARCSIVRLGSTDLPWIPFVEGIYGYRYVENTLIDRDHFGTSADWGVHRAGRVRQRPDPVCSLGGERRRLQEDRPHQRHRLRRPR